MRTPAFIILLFILNFDSHALQKYERVTVIGEQTQSPRLQNSNSFNLDNDKLKTLDIYHTDQIWDLVPNLNTAGGSNRLRFIQIRGIGERSEFDSVPTNSVGYYYDHIDLSGISGVVATYDTESIQVLKGPQSHLFGDSSIGGNILTATEWSLSDASSAWTGYGSQNRLRLGAKTQQSLNDSLSVKLGFQKQKSDGFIYNSHLSEHTSERDELFTSAGLFYTANGLELRTSHVFADQKNGYDVWSTTNDKFTTTSDRPGRDEQKTWGHSIEATKTLNKTSKITLISSLSLTDILYSFDEDWGNDIFWNQVPGWNADYDYNKVYDRDRRHFHTKALYQQNVKDGFFNLGAHYTNRIDDSLITSFNDGAERKNLNSRFDSKHFAILTGLQKKLTSSLKLNVNGRVEEQSIDYSDSNSFQGSPDTRLYGFSFSLNKMIKNHNFTAKVSRGYKGAGFNPEINLTSDQQFYSPESFLNYELIWSLVTKNIDAKFTAFYMDRDNQQIQTSSQDNPSDPSDFTVFIDNAAETENYGLETEISLFTNSPLNLNFSAGLLKARFKSYTLEGVDLSGRDLAHAPLYTFALSGAYKISDKVMINARLTGKDEFFFSNSHNQKSSSYTLLSAGAQYKPYSNTRVSIWGRNILDKKYAARGFFFGNEPPNFDARLFTQAGAALEYGVDVSVNF